MRTRDSDAADGAAIRVIPGEGKAPDRFDACGHAANLRFGGYTVTVPCRGQRGHGGLHYGTWGIAWERRRPRHPAGPDGAGGSDGV